MTQPFQAWIEPLIPGADAEQGLRARVADPVWFLARQWRLGELQGEDASSPVGVRLTVGHARLRCELQPQRDPAVIPAEALIEAEPGDWWTPGRRIRLGRAAKPLLTGLANDALVKLRLGAMPSPYTGLADELDGQKVFEQGFLAGHAIWEEVPPYSPDGWSSRALNYSATFTATGHHLEVREHDGGDVDWFAVDGTGASVATGESSLTTERIVVPGRIDYPGAPRPRWWQIEDHAVDLGGFAPDRSHLGTMLLLDVAVSHSDDWFWFSVPLPLPQSRMPSSGVVTTLHEVWVKDSFDQEWPIQAPSDWSLFRTRGLDPTSLVVWPVAAASHSGPVLDEVVLGVDDDANLAWAMEMKANGKKLLDDSRSDEALREVARTGTRAFEYRPSTTLPQHWYPYRRCDGGGLFGDWEQGRVAAYTEAQADEGVLPGPRSPLLCGSPEPDNTRGHVIDGRTVPSSGVVLRRRAMLARDAIGRPVLWIERSSHPLLGPPASNLRFDVFDEDS
ncbi:MAG: hypothetical protein NW204_09480 [Xanthomonadaceae bacterium]|nr:hypothetical protein [Xanthomonadaceae bacterium]